MSITRKEMKEEALARMVMLHLHPSIISDFDEKEKLTMSFGGLMVGPKEEQIEYVREFEKDHNCLVYYVIRTYTTLGEMLTFLYVSAYQEEWERDREDLKEGYPFAYVVNVDDEMCSEFGSVGIKSQFGRLIRTA